MRQAVFLFFMFVISVSCYSQKTKVIYNEKFTQGNYLILEKNYSLALRYFKEAYNIDSTSANINYKLGLCYLQSPSEKHKAVYHLEKAVQNVVHNYSPEDVSQVKASDLAFYSLGIAYRLAYNFNASDFCFKKFKEMIGSNNSKLTADLDRQIYINANAQEFIKDTAKVTIVNMGDSINSPYPDYSSVISADDSTLIFTSKRTGSVGGLKTDDDQFYEDIYVCYKKNDGSWTTAKSIGFNINSSVSEANLGLSPDGKLLYVCKDINGGDIYYSNLVDDVWSSLTPLSKNINSPNWESRATVSADGSTLYFVSNRKEGSYGGLDIWRCIKLPNGQWSLPANLGPNINTAEDEESPFIHPDGITLFFSSKGHKNMGGFDVFKSTKEEDEKWSKAENLRAHINTPDDDLFFVQTSDNKRGYFSSIRKGNYGEKDIYRVDFENIVIEPLSLLKGILTFNGTNKTPSNVKITATNAETGQVVQKIKPNELTGKYIMILPLGVNGKTYNINFEADGYQSVSVSLNIPPNTSYQEIEKEFLMQLINLESKTLGTIGIKGVVRNKEGKPIPGATINMQDNLTGKFIETFNTTIDSGSYYFIVNREQNYNINYEAKGYLFHSENVNIPKNAEYENLKKDVVLEKIEIGSKIVLNNIFFESNKLILTKESNLEIDKLVKFMIDNPELVIEVSGHTDNKGNPAANLKLSQSRSQVVVNALIEKGINKTKLIAKGYGQTVPLVPNVLSNGKPDLKGMQQNRRVELKIIE